MGPFSQFSALAMMRALVVLPTPRTPVKRNAWATRLAVDGVAERARHVLLAHQIAERLRAPLAGQDEVAHRAFGYRIGDEGGYPFTTSSMASRTLPSSSSRSASGMLSGGATYTTLPSGRR